MELFTWTISTPCREHVVFCRQEDGLYTLIADSRVVGVYRRSWLGGVTWVDQPLTLYGLACRFVVWPGLIPQPDLILEGRSLEKGVPFRAAWMEARICAIALSFVVLGGVLALTWLWHSISQPAPVWSRVGEGAICAVAAAAVIRNMLRIRRERIALFGPAK
jgi:hypothetical protein